uniref:Uncharacterized protein n=1 Tax=Salix viminalis TaxID=40686 RepID=A0A6N2M231_SALVM
MASHQLEEATDHIVQLPKIVEEVPKKAPVTQDASPTITSHLYVLTSTFPNGIQDPDDILGVLSVIIYSILTITIGKYTFMKGEREVAEMVEPEEPKIAETTMSEAVEETSKKMNKSGRKGEREVTEMVEPQEPKIVEANRSEAVVETSKKMNKSERTTQEKDALDKILTKQGEKTPTSKSSAPPPQEEKPS